jgi:hypothetical protein
MKIRNVVPKTQAGARKKIYFRGDIKPMNGETLLSDQRFLYDDFLGPGEENICFYPE